MATITLSLTVGAQTFSHSASFANSDATRLQAAYAALYGTNLPPNPTADQIWKALAQSVFQEIKGQVLAHERRVQQPSIPDIPMT